jgi:hypothetical protein
MSNILITGSSIIISTDSYATDESGSHVIDDTKVSARWELDPQDSSSFQLRVPSSSFGGAADRIAFYLSGSGKIGIGTKDPSSDFEVAGSGKAVFTKLTTTDLYDAQRPNISIRHCKC